MIVGCVTLVVINTLLYGFVTWLPTFFIKQGLSIATSFGYTLLMGLGAPVGAAIGALTADSWGRKPTIIGASAGRHRLRNDLSVRERPVLLPIVGFALTVPIYVLVAVLFGIYIPELFPTEVRLRASGFCNTFGRGATIVTPFIVVSLFQVLGITGVLALMVGLLFVQIITVACGLGVEPRHRSLEELKARGNGCAGAQGSVLRGRRRRASRKPQRRSPDGAQRNPGPASASDTSRIALRSIRATRSRPGYNGARDDRRQSRNPLTASRNCRGDCSCGTCGAALDDLRVRALREARGQLVRHRRRRRLVVLADQDEDRDLHASVSAGTQDRGSASASHRRRETRPGSDAQERLRGESLHAARDAGPETRARTGGALRRGDSLQPSPATPGRGGRSARGRAPENAAPLSARTSLLAISRMPDRHLQGRNNPP